MVDVEVSHTAGDGGRWCHGPCQAPPPGQLRYAVPAGTRLILDILSTNRPSPHGLVDGWALEEDATSDATEHAGGVGAVGLSCLFLSSLVECWFEQTLVLTVSVRATAALPRWKAGTGTQAVVAY
eukprot:COSAG01_NODE_5716_length_4081_cov_1.855851_2_plen_125_part_00